MTAHPPDISFCLHIAPYSRLKCSCGHILIVICTRIVLLMKGKNPINELYSTYTHCLPLLLLKLADFEIESGSVLILSTAHLFTFR